MLTVVKSSVVPQRQLGLSFQPSQPQRIISGLRETFIKRYIVERTNKAEIRPVEQSEKAESSREDVWNEIQLKEPRMVKVKCWS